MKILAILIILSFSTTSFAGGSQKEEPTIEELKAEVKKIKKDILKAKERQMRESLCKELYREWRNAPQIVPNYPEPKHIRYCLINFKITQ